MKKKVWLCVLCVSLLPVLCGCKPAAPVPSESPAPAALFTPAAETEAASPAPEAALHPAAEREETADDSPSEPAVYPQYEALIARVEHGLQSGWTEIAPEELGVSDVFRRTDGRSLGWIQLDINGDGRDELLFGEITEEAEPSPIYDIFALPAEEPVHSAGGWEFNRWYLTEGGQLINEASSTGYDVYRTGYGFFNGALVPARVSADRGEYMHLQFERFNADSP